MRTGKSKLNSRAHIGNGHTLRFGIKSIGSNAEQAMTLVGQFFPAAKDSTVVEKVINCQPNPSGISCWLTLSSGIRVCVRYSDWRPILYVGKVKENGG